MERRIWPIADLQSIAIKETSTRLGLRLTIKSNAHVPGVAIGQEQPNLPSQSAVDCKNIKDNSPSCAVNCK